MGSIILCHKKKARNPYEINQIQRKIYTIEELCYYLCNHLYLIDHTIMNSRLCDWLEEELELCELAGNLRQSLEQNSSPEQFAITILAYSSIYTTSELSQIQSVLNKLKNQKPIEKQKCKADNLLDSGAVKQAVLLYQSIVHGEIDDSVDKKFYGRVYACLGAAYGRLLLYEEAAKMYEAAFQICEEEAMLKAYIYACRQYMSKEEYRLFLQRSPVYQGVELSLQEEIAEMDSHMRFSVDKDALEQWKGEYRRMGTGE